MRLQHELYPPKTDHQSYVLPWRGEGSCPRCSSPASFESSQLLATSPPLETVQLIYI